jgi:hypothetical protein
MATGHLLYSSNLAELGAQNIGPDVLEYEIYRANKNDINYLAEFYWLS